MQPGWYEDPANPGYEQFHNGGEWTDMRREKKGPSTDGSSNALFWVAAVAGLIGMIVGLRPSPNYCGSAWFPDGCAGGGLASATAVSVVFMLIAGAAIITAIAIRNRTP